MGSSHFLQRWDTQVADEGGLLNRWACQSVPKVRILLPAPTFLQIGSLVEPSYSGAARWFVHFTDNEVVVGSSPISRTNVGKSPSGKGNRSTLCLSWVRVPLSLPTRGPIRSSRIPCDFRLRTNLIGPFLVNTNGSQTKEIYYAHLRSVRSRI